MQEIENVSDHCTLPIQCFLPLKFSFEVFIMDFEVAIKAIIIHLHNALCFTYSKTTGYFWSIELCWFSFTSFVIEIQQYVSNCSHEAKNLKVLLLRPLWSHQLCLKK